MRDFRRRWATMRSVVENNTIQEDLACPAGFDIPVEPLCPVADLRADDGHRRHPSHGAGICTLPGPPSARRSGATGTDGLRSDRPV